MSTIGFVAIGRNEGERLKRCLSSLRQISDRIVYVDSGSKDGSVDFARELGVNVVQLDVSQGFTMARARNAGWKRLLEISPGVTHVQFIDGDCELVDSWLPLAQAYTETHANIAVVCGRRRERFPERSLYNRLTDIEWNTPVGEARSCGGDALFRRSVLEAAGGYQEDLIAGEEPELCQRIRREGWKIARIDGDMTWHDADMLSFSQWWKRYVRGGYGASDVACRSALSGALGRDILFGDQVRSARLWTLGTLLLLLAAALVTVLLSQSLVFLVTAAGLGLAWVLQGVRIGISQRRRAGGLGIGIIYGLLLMLAKWPQALGCWKYSSDVRRGLIPKLIEYKK